MQRLIAVESYGQICMGSTLGNLPGIRVDAAGQVYGQHKGTALVQTAYQPAGSKAGRPQYTMEPGAVEGIHNGSKALGFQYRTVSADVHWQGVQTVGIPGTFNFLHLRSRHNEWMMRFLKWHIKDPNILWLIQKYLKAGVMVDEKYEDTDEGTIQGGNISPTYIYIYMHNVLTLWFKLVIQKEAKGESFLVNYADDFVAGFQYKSDAEHYYAALKERMAKFNLELEESKSRLIEFGRYAEQNRRARGLGKPETFDFLGFTLYYGKSRKGYPWPKVKTSRKKFEKKLREFKEWLYDSKNQPAKDIVKQLNVKRVGYYRYYGVSFNIYKLSAFLHRVQQFLFKAMNRRGCRRTYTWNGFIDMLKYYPLAKPKVYYPLY